MVVGDHGRTRVAQWFAHEAPRPHHQHHSHHQKLGHQRELRKRKRHTEKFHCAQCNAQSFDFGNQQRRHKRTRNRTHATDDHHNKRVANGGHVEPQMCGLAG